ncbi:MAG: flagellar biosynthetic protein FliR [Phycisphaerales bacterium]|nr:flagellar biosynthetic protein FliR [Phycisphaerales bacterium]
MPLTLFENYQLLPAFLLVLFRMAGLMVSAPLFSGTLLPTPVKVLLVVAMSAALFPMVLPAVVAPVTLGSALTGLFGELCIGILLGFGVTLLFSGIQLGMQAAAQQAGLGLANSFDPTMETETADVVQLYNLVAMFMFLGIGGHRALIRALLDSFQSIPPLQFAFGGAMLDVVVRMIGASFTIAIRVGGPVMLTLLLAFVTLGFVSRTVPQLNILNIGFPLKLMLAMLVMALTILAFEKVFLDSLADFLNLTREALGLAPQY